MKFVNPKGYISKDLFESIASMNQLEILELDFEEEK